MKPNKKRKMFMGIGGLMIPIPRFISDRGLERGVAGARGKVARLTEDERRIHHFIVGKMAVVEEPITAVSVSEELGLEPGVVQSAIDKLEELKTFLYRSGGPGVDWAYPLSLDNTGHRMTAGTGERFFGA